MNSLKKIKGWLRRRIVNLTGSLLGRQGIAFRVLKGALLENALLEKFSSDPMICSCLARDGTLSREIEFRKVWHTVRKSLDFDASHDPESYALQKSLYVKDRVTIKEAILNIVCKDNFFMFGGKQVKFWDRDSVWILINEILINEEYYFFTENPTPRILDCGCHFGMATLYFKKLYPKAMVTAFEPIPQIYNFATENFKALGLDDIELLPYALSDKEKTSTFYVSNERPMGSSLHNRFHDSCDTVHKIDVECKKLSNYLQEKVHYLKLDIEGAEDRVLLEAGECLRNVHYLFLEFHFIDKRTNERLAAIIALLERFGFDLHITKSWTSQARSSRRPLEYVGEPLSHVLWGKNREFSESK